MSTLRIFSLAFSTILTGALSSSPVQALPVTGLYAHEVAVGGDSDGERSRAFRDALAAVIVKVTGGSAWLDNSAVQQALGRAQSFVQEFQYRTELVDLALVQKKGPWQR